MGDKFCCLLQAACEASKDLESKDLERALQSTKDHRLRSQSHALSLRKSAPRVRRIRDCDLLVRTGTRRAWSFANPKNEAVDGDGGLKDLPSNSKECSNIQGGVNHSIAQMEFRGSKVEPRIVKRGRVVLQYLFDQHQKGQENTLESAVRRDIGNTPDTSKALRMLVHARKINRSGRGGRSDPFKYEIPHGVLEEMSEIVHPPAQLVQVTTTAGTAQREIQTMPELDQHISPRSSDRAAAVVSEDEQAAMSPPLSPSSLNTDQGRPNKCRRIRFGRVTSTLDPMGSDSRAQNGSYACRASAMPLNIPALSEGSTGPGRFTFTQALNACRKDYQGTTAAAPSSKADKGDKSHPREGEALRSSQDSMLSDSNSKMWHFRPAYPVSSYKHPTSHVEGTKSACQQEQLILVAQHNTPLAGTPWHVSPSTAETCSAFQSERNCCVPFSQNTVQAPGNGSPFWEQAQASSATQRGGQKHSFDKENAAEERGMTQYQEHKKTDMGSQEAHNAHLHSRTPATNQGPGLQSLAGMGKRAAPPPLFKPPTV